MCTSVLHKKSKFHSYKDPGSFLLFIIQIFIWVWELRVHVLELPHIPYE